jgi:hypothetical protein
MSVPVVLAGNQRTVAVGHGWMDGCVDSNFEGPWRAAAGRAMAMADACALAFCSLPLLLLPCRRPPATIRSFGALFPLLFMVVLVLLIP